MSSSCALLPALGAPSGSEVAELVADVVLEVLHLVEVGRPVQLAVAYAAPALQADGAAQAFAALGEVPHHTVVAAVRVAARAGDVVVLAHAPVRRVVEHLLAA
jgi:hypothetical protein